MNKEKAKVTIWSSSHCAPKRKFPVYFQNLFLNQNRFNTPIINAIGGQRLTSSLTDKIVDSIRNSENTQDIHVLILGDNDLRHETTIKSIIENFEKITEYASFKPNCVIIVCSLIHGKLFDKQLKDKFFKLDRKLRILSNSKPEYVRFVNLRQHLDKETSFANDCVHLNAFGTKRLADTVYHAICCVPHTVV